MKLNTNFFYIAGYAGHGKDTANNIAKTNYTNEFDEIKMAETLKTNATALITQEFKDITQLDNPMDVLNALKDNHSDMIFFANMNTRVFLQKLGTEFYRSLNDSIHTTFVAAKILNKLEHSTRDDIVFASTDIRFPNELDFMLKLSQIQGEDLKDYLKFLLKNVANTLPTDSALVNHFENVFSVSRHDERTKLILNSVLESVATLKKVSDYQKEWDIKAPDTRNMKKEDAIKYGLLHIFRPILDPKAVYDKNLKSQTIVEEIKKYTGLEYGKIAEIMKYYKTSEVDFNTDNVIKYGFLRADIRHPSENAINDMKPEAILSTPLKDSKFNDELMKLLSIITLKESVDLDLTSDIKKNNSINRGLK